MNALPIILAVLLLCTSGGLLYLFLQNRKLGAAHTVSLAEIEQLKTRLAGIADLDAEKAQVLSDIAEARAKALEEAAKIRLALEAEQAQIQAQILAGRNQAKDEAEKIRQAIAREQARAQNEINTSRTKTQQEVERIQMVIAAEQRKVEDARQDSARQIATIDGNIALKRAELAELDEELNLQSFAFYQPHYDFADSAMYQSRLEEIRDQQKKLIKDKRAAVGAIEWTVNGSKSEGKKQINQTLKLMLRAFNGECDASVAKVKYNNVHVMESRIQKAQEKINALAQVQQCFITPEYLGLKLQELYLAYEYQDKVQQEKEEQRAIREQMREEEIARRELEKAQQDAEREEKRYEEALAKARAEVESAVGAKQAKLSSQIAELEKRLAEAHAQKERAISRAQMTRSGYVYIISNVGSFGENVYKIGMTRRLDPMDRVRELGDASVPFTFDVHAIIYCDDAPTLENELHRLFATRRVNMINERKEFFRVHIDEIEAVVMKHHGTFELTKAAEAKEYHQTMAKRRELGQQKAPAIPLPGGTPVGVPVNPPVMLVPQQVH